MIAQVLNPAPAPNPRLEHALAYAELGWRVVPLHSVIAGKWCSCTNRECTSQGKHPRLKMWQNKATTDPQTIESWWGAWPDAGVGIATGAESGLVVLDVDRDYAGLESWAHLKSVVPMPDTAVSLTGSGGMHILFEHPGAGVYIKNRSEDNALMPGIHVRGDGGFIVAPPSRNLNGPYLWEVSYGFDDTPLAPIPDGLLKMLLHEGTRAPQGAQEPVDERIGEGGRNHGLARLGGAMRRRGFSEGAILAALLEENAIRCDPPLDDDEVGQIARSVARYEPEPEPPILRVQSAPVNEETGELNPFEPLRVWEQEEPEPRRWAMAGWIPDGAITVLFGDGGMGKSYIALYIAILTCLGGRFGNIPMEQRRSLYLDAELDAEEFARRAYAVARGMGLERPPVGLHYLRLPGSIAKPVVQQGVAATIAKLNIEFTVLDSMSIGAAGDNPSEAEDIIKTMTGLKEWGTVLAIDHISKPQAGANLSHYSQFGSVFKRNIARSSIRLIQAQGGGIALQPDKSNFGPKPDPLYLNMSFSLHEVAFQHVDVNDDSMAGITDHLPATERVYQLLDEQDDKSSTVIWLSEQLGMTQKTIKNHLTVLRRQKRVDTDNGGQWFVVQPPHLSVAK